MFSQDKADAICARLAEGVSLVRICEIAEFPSRTEVNRWLADDENEAFRDNYARARESFADAEFDAITEICDAAPERDDKGRIDPAWVATQKLKIDTRKWTLARMNKKYNDKIDIEHSGRLVHAHEMTDAELGSIAAASGS